MEPRTDAGTQRVSWRVIAVFALVVTTCALGNLSQTGMSAMIPSIMADLHVDVALAQWLTTGYMLVIGVSVPIATYLSNRTDARTHLVIGEVLFAAGVFMDWLALSFPVMLAGRLLQAVSVGILFPLLQNIAMMQFPPGRRATAMGVGGIAMGFAPNIGPTVGGALEFAFGWRSFFVLLLAVNVVLLVLTLLLVRKSKPVQPDVRFEGVSFVFSTLGFGGLLLGISEASSHGFASAYVWVPIAIGIVFIVLFVRRQSRVDDPLIHLEIFRDSVYVRGLIAIVFLFGSFLGVTLTIPLFVQDFQGGTSLDAGLVLLPATISALIMNPLSGILADKFGARPVCITFSIFLAVGSALWIFIDAQTPLWVLMLYQVIRSIGTSGLIGPFQTWSLSNLEPRVIPDGSSMSVLARQTAASLGTALCVFAIAGLGGFAAEMGMPALAYQISFGISAVLAIAALVHTILHIR